MKPERFKILFTNIELNEYRELILQDLRDQFEELSYGSSKPRKKVCQKLFYYKICFIVVQNYK